jgi:tetratricopeptide (TPR) repeat protein
MGPFRIAVKYRMVVLVALCACALAGSDGRATQTAEKLWREAVHEAETGHREHALELLSQVLETAPDFLPARQQRARMLFDDGRFADAQKDAGEAARLDPDDGLTVLLNAECLRRSGRNEEAIREYDHVASLQVASADLYEGRAAAWAAAGQFAKAVDDYDRAIHAHPDDAVAQLGRGNARAALGDDSNALADLDAAVRLDPKNVDAWISRARVLSKLNRNQDALTDLTRAILLEPKDANLHLARAAVLEKMERHQEALQDRDTAVQLGPDLPEAYTARGESWAELGLTEKAIADEDVAIRLNPALAEPWCARGKAKFAAGDLHGAREDVAHALTLREKYEEAQRLLAAIDSKLNPVVEAKAAPPAIAPPPVPVKSSISAEEHDLRARKLIAAGHLQEAIAESSEAIRLKPDFAPAWNGRAYAHLLAREYREAIADASEAVRLDPKYKNALQVRAAAQRAVSRSH